MIAGRDMGGGAWRLLPGAVGPGKSGERSCQDKERFMRREAAIAVVVALALAGRSLAQQTSPADLRDKSPITSEDRQAMAAWLTAQVKRLTGSDAGAMVSAREAILSEGRRDPSFSKDFVQAFGEEAIAALETAEKRSLSVGARLNVVMAAAGLGRLEGIPILQKVLTGDPYPATRYWAAKGLSDVTAAILAAGKIRAEQEIAKSIGAAFQNESDPLALFYLFNTLGQFDHEEAHDVLAQGVMKMAVRVDGNDAAGSQALGEMVKGVERAYTADVRPEAKTRLLSAYAALCAGITPPLRDPLLMAALNASLEKVTGESVGFKAGEKPEMQKLALLEWVEKLVRAKKIPARPALPPAVDRAVKEAMGIAPEPEPAPKKAPEEAPKKAVEPAPKAVGAPAAR